jgi:hypothetical protein
MHHALQVDDKQQTVLDLKTKVIELQQEVEIARRRARIDADCATDPRCAETHLRIHLYMWKAVTKPESTLIALRAEIIACVHDMHVWTCMCVCVLYSYIYRHTEQEPTLMSRYGPEVRRDYCMYS